MLGRERIGDGAVFVGVGYTLDGQQDYSQGKLAYDTMTPGRALRVYFPYDKYWIPAQHTWDNLAVVSKGGESSVFLPKDGPVYFRHGNPYVLDMVLSIAPSQSQCVFAYRDVSGFDCSTTVKHDAMEAVQEVFDGYATDVEWIYKPNVGYRMRCWSNSDEKASYYDFINFWENLCLGYMLYRRWTDNRADAWARRRAFEIAAFFLEKQRPNGAVARVWDLDNQRYHGVGDVFHELGVVFSPLSAAASAQYLHMLYELCKETEGVAHEEWAQGAQKAIDWVIRLLRKDKGYLRHSYNDQDQGVLNAIEATGLYALRYFHQRTGEAKYLEALTLYEDTLQDLFGKNNDWYNGLRDCNSLKGPIDGEQYRNYYTLNVYALAGYYTDRYLDTGDAKYLQRAQDHFAFGWMGRMPINLPGYQHLTKGVVEEQNIWVFYDMPWPINSSAGFMRMARAVEDPFYAAYFKALVHTQLDFTHLGERHPFCSQTLGAHTDKRLPLDRFAEINEGKFGVWLTGYTGTFVYDMLSDEMYYYIGGKDFGVGLDYDAAFAPDLGDGVYIRACSVRVLDAKLTRGALGAKLSGLARKNCQFILKIAPEKAPKRVLLGGQDVPFAHAYDQRLGECTVRFDLPQGQTALTIQF